MTRHEAAALQQALQCGPFLEAVQAFRLLRRAGLAQPQYHRGTWLLPAGYIAGADGFAHFVGPLPSEHAAAARGGRLVFAAAMGQTLGFDPNATPTGSTT